MPPQEGHRSKLDRQKEKQGETRKLERRPLEHPAETRLWDLLKYGNPECPWCKGFAQRVIWTETGPSLCCWDDHVDSSVQRRCQAAAKMREAAKIS